MSWLAIIKLLITLAVALLEQARRRQTISDAEAAVMLRALKESQDAADRATRARDDALRDFDDRGGVPDDSDPNLRD